MTKTTRLFLLILFLVGQSQIFAQKSSINGKVTDANTGIILSPRTSTTTILSPGLLNNMIRNLIAEIPIDIFLVYFKI